jgi:hypothetical protein
MQELEIEVNKEIQEELPLNGIQRKKLEKSIKSDSI